MKASKTKVLATHSLAAVVSLCFAAKSSALTQSSENHKSLVVKTYSRLCDNAQFDFRGSGTMFKSSSTDPSIYVLTSEHVLLQGTKAKDHVCHTVSYQSKTPQGDATWLDASAELVATDWQSGLAILKLELNAGSLANDIPTYGDLIAKEPTGESFDVAGLPYGVERELRADSGKFSAENSLRHLMPNGSPVFELQDADGEFGMSGGPVFDHDGKLTGLLSHQFLVQRQGRTSAIAVFGEDNQPTHENHLILIRGADLTTWIDAALKENFAPGFVRSLADQTSGGDAVYVGDMKFTAVSQENDCTTAATQSDELGFVSIGGGDPVGIGGSDPVGIGGDGPGLPKSISVSISLDRDAPELAKKSRWNIPRLEAWHNQVTEAALRNETLEVPSIIYRDPQHPEKGVSRVCVRSLEEFFRKVIVDGSSAVTYRKGGASDIDPAPQIKALMAQGEKLLATSTQLYESSDQLKKMQLIQYSRMYGSLLAGVNNWSLVKPTDLSPLRCVSDPSCSYRKQWTDLFESSDTNTKAQELLSSISGACRLLKTLTTGDNTKCD
jgi:hypothetical protein